MRQNPNPSRNRKLSTRELERRLRKQRTAEKGGPLKAVIKIIDGVMDRIQDVIDPQENKSRREFLLQSGMAVTGIAMATTTGVSLIQRHNDLSSTIDEADEIAASDYTLEKLPYGQLVPEDERHASDLLIAVNTKDYPFPLMDDLVNAAHDALEEYLDPLIKEVPKHVKVHLLIPDGTLKNFEEETREKYPGREFAFYEIPPSQSGAYYYAQDFVSATGMKDEEGRFITMNNIGRRDKHEQIYQLTAYKDERAQMAVTNLGGEMVSRRYADTFNGAQLPLYSKGGDAFPGRLPDGRLAYFLGRQSLHQSIMSFFKRRDGSMPYYDDGGRIYNNIEIEDFTYALEEIKSTFREYYGVDEVVVIGEDYLRDMAEMTGDLSLGEIRQGAFFDIDMVIRPCTTPKGDKVVFCSDVSKYSDQYRPSDLRYLESVEQQMRDQGYTMIPLPTGKFATMNYTNVNFFTETDGNKAVQIPQFGIPEDEIAVKAYENQGFKVLKANYGNVNKYAETDRDSRINRIKEDAGLLTVPEADNLGGPHCSAVVLF